MPQEGFKRKLTAILSADAVGYSRLMREDEEATVRDIAAHRVLITKIIKQYHGRVIDSPGDNILAEFASVVDAVNGAIKIQEEIKRSNTDTPKNHRMEFRIGINLGDVIEEEERIYGDGVNIAARVEGVAAAGGISISGTVYEHIKNKVSLGYHYLGEQNVKNIPEPIRVYRLLTESEDVGKMIGEEKPKIRKWLWTAFGAIALVILVIGTVAIWNYYFHPSVEPDSAKKMAFPLPDKPSIAVLPFDNLSKNPEQEYFADGMTDDLITDLSKISGLFVIARNSTFQYKGKTVDLKQVSRELGIRYVLEGSVRRVGEKVRINAQLIDATTGGHLWAERYDGSINDIFSLQDTINQKIITALSVKLVGGEEGKVVQKETNSVEAYDALLKGWSHYVRRTPSDFAEAKTYFERAIGLDPKYGRAYAALASTYWESMHSFWHSNLGVSWGGAKYMAEEYLDKAMEYPTTLSHQVATKLLIDFQQYEKALIEAERSIASDPNDPNSHLAMAYALIYSSRHEEAFSFIKKAMRLDPEYPDYYLFILGLAQFGMERLDAAVSSLERALTRNPENYVPLIPLAASYGLLGKQQEAEAAIVELKRALPFMSASVVMGCPLWRYKNRIDKERLLNGLRKAGLT